MATGGETALSLPDGPQFRRLLLGMLAAGATAAPLNPTYTEDEFRFYLEDLAPRALLLPAGRTRDRGRRGHGRRQVAATLSVSIGRRFEVGEHKTSMLQDFEAD